MPGRAIDPPHIAPAAADFLGKLDHDLDAICGDPWANCLAATDNMSTEKTPSLLRDQRTNRGASRLFGEFDANQGSLPPADPRGIDNLVSIDPEHEGRRQMGWPVHSKPGASNANIGDLGANTIALPGGDDPPLLADRVTDRSPAGHLQPRSLSPLQRSIRGPVLVDSRTWLKSTRFSRTERQALGNAVQQVCTRQTQFSRSREPSLIDLVEVRLELKEILRFEVECIHRRNSHQMSARMFTNSLPTTCPLERTSLYCCL